MLVGGWEGAGLLCVWKSSYSKSSYACRTGREFDLLSDSGWMIGHK